MTGPGGASRHGENKPLVSLTKGWAGPAQPRTGRASLGLLICKVDAGLPVLPPWGLCEPPGRGLQRLRTAKDLGTEDCGSLSQSPAR